ncbi:phosphoenolpyruvate--protein phosphotransferase [Sphingomonas aerophila]|uniref:phosphoenolpyruvate--protein phosphotransferase n=1 Tax=Sphingomonas aerophila TaxID=1344948 RepID=A0A7W9BCM4_9SPHN|nr:phosphoenolpyruvate--protein phosphotransferase [Sphingomonas aerophila]MBB5714568.1 phosphocarrier protein FPr/phosphocarrier protein [Sphingomonas aerophila]
MTGITLHAPFAGWLGPLDEVPDAVFAERMMGDGFAIDPTEGVLRAPADGEVVSVPTSAHAITLRLENGAEILLHIGLETIALGGRGFSSLVTSGEHVCRGQSLIEFDLDQVARDARDLITPVVAANGGSVRIINPGRLVAAGDPVAEVAASGASDTEAVVIEASRVITVMAPHGLHARPAARIVQLLTPFSATVRLTHEDKQANARSIVALLALGAAQGAQVHVAASGPDADAALDALEQFASERFGDSGDGLPPPPLARSGPVCAVPGIAIGRVCQFRPATIDVAEQGAGVEAEIAALQNAIRATGASLGTDDLAQAHRMILSDPDLQASASRFISEGKSAGWAWRNATKRASASLRGTGDVLLAERVADLEDVEAQLLGHLTGRPMRAPVIEPNTILIAPDLLPSQFLGLNLTNLEGICTAAGGPTAHVAVLAAAAGIPMLVAAGPGVLHIADGDPAILDAENCRLTVNPDASALDAASVVIASRREARTGALRAAQQPCTTADGTRIEVFANLGSVDDAAAAVRAGAEGCGLLRTEFLFLDRAEAPTEAEQQALYAAIATTLDERPLIIRTLDIGGDKPVPYLHSRPEENPALGQRGVRLSLARPDLLETQLRAILAGVPGAQCRIMLPMIADIGEVEGVRASLNRATLAIGRTDPVQLGIMVETPAAAMIADHLAAKVDFLSIGTNDLTQYTLAADRGNAGVAAMVDALHPAVLRLIARTVEGAGRHGRWVGVCGSLGSDPRVAPLLVGLGITELSAVPAIVPEVKAAIRAVTIAAARALAARALAATSAAEVRALLEEQA